MEMVKDLSHLQAFARAGAAAWTSVSSPASFPWLILIHPAGLNVEVAFSRKPSRTPALVLPPPRGLLQL